jgi:hypothetical protein
VGNFQKAWGRKVLSLFSFFRVLYSVVRSKVKVKVNFTLEQATKAQKGSRGIALLFL